MKMNDLQKKCQPILLVDDDQDDQLVLCEALNTLDSDYELLLANNGMEAINLLSNMKVSGSLPGLIILDMNMPVMDGKQTLLQIQQDQELAKVPVVIFTTSVNDEEKLYFSTQGIVMYTKPYKMEHYFEIARKMLDLYGC